MADLAKRTSKVVIVGKVKLSQNSFSDEQVGKTGFKYKSVNIGIETEEGNVIYGQMMGGYNPNKPVINSNNKEDNKKFEVNWGDRLNEAIIDTVADFKIHKVGLEKEENGTVKMKKFLSPWDVHDYLKTHLVDGMEVCVIGAFSFSEYKDETQRRFEIQSIYLPFERKDKETGEVLPTKCHASFTQTILLNENSFKRIRKEDAEAGEVTIACKVVDYVGKKDGKEIKKNLTFPLGLTVKINKENPEATEKILNALFKIKKGKVRELTVEGQIIEGYEKQEINEKDVELSPEIKELIALGLYSEEEAKKKMTIRGNKVSKLIFIRPYLSKKDGNLVIDMDDEKYTPDDLIVPIEEESSTSSEVDEREEDSAVEDSDTSWMKALGL